MTGQFVNPSWMPHSVSEAARAGDATADDLMSGRAWSHLLGALRRASEVVLSESGRNAADVAAGFRHLLVLLVTGADQGLRAESSPVLAVKPSGVDNVYKWGMDCPDCIYAGAPLRGGETYRLWGNRGTARYVGLQSMAGMASSANVLLDELDLGPSGEVELVISADEHEGNWLPMDPTATTLVVRHFFYDWDTEVASSLSIERADGAASRTGRPPAEDPRAVAARQLVALGDFVVANLEFFLQFSRPETPNTFLPPLDGTAMGAAAENRPVIGSFELGPDESLLLEVTPPQGLYWSYSLGNPWWETIDYAGHQSSLNGHQAVVDDDGMMRAVIAHEDPGIANWLDTAGHSAGPVILRYVRTDTAPIPTARVIPFADVAAALPAGTRRVTADERQAVLAARRRAVSKRFAR